MWIKESRYQWQGYQLKDGAGEANINDKGGLTLGG